MHAVAKSILLGEHEEGIEDDLRVLILFKLRLETRWLTFIASSACISAGNLCASSCTALRGRNDASASARTRKKTGIRFASDLPSSPSAAFTSVSSFLGFAFSLGWLGGLTT